MPAELTTASPFPRRFLAWVLERFPPAHVLLAAALYGGALLGGRALAAPGPVALAPTDLLGFLAAVAYFLVLRVVDEHKDFEADRAAHPGRVLSRGVVTLQHLRVAGGLALATQAAVCLWIDRGPGRSLALWGATLGYTLLMARDFFAGQAPRARPVVHLLHLLAMPLAMLWFIQLGLGDRPLPPLAAWLVGLSLLFAVAFDGSRRLAARPGAGSPGLVLAALAVAALVLAAALRGVRGGAVGIVPAALLALIVLLPGWALVQLGRSPSSRGARRAAGLTAVAVLLDQALLCGVVLVERGLRG